MTRRILEVCVSTPAEAAAAAEAGADRLELCAALETGGVTPSAGLLAEVLRAVAVPVVVLVRPRSGDFQLSLAEHRAVVADVKALLAAGAAGAVVGDLTADRQLPPERLAELRDAAAGRELVFHRAFDQVADRAAALEMLVELGFDRVLASGGSAGLDAAALGWLHRQAAGRIAILPGGGVASGNLAELLRVSGCREVHGSFRSGDRDGGPPPSDGCRVNAAEVRRARALLDRPIP